MSELETFAEHARRLSKSAHLDDCTRIHRIVKRSQWLEDRGLDGTLSCPSEDGHEPHEWIGGHGMDWTCPGMCSGCMPDSQSVLWARLADEIDAYLTPADEGDLFGGST